MLVLPTDPQWKGRRPANVTSFLDFLAERLDAWTVTLTAYDNDAPDDLDSISAEVLASYGDLLVSITRHAGFDTILVGLRGASPTFPFEDLAAACEWTSKESVLALADQDPNDHQPLFPLEDALGILDQSRDELPDQLKSHRFRGHLRSIADEFGKRLFA